MNEIVMIDDEPWALKGIRNIINWESYGFDSVKTFGNPLEAFDYILAEDPDVVCTDVRMPMMDGLDLIEKCREHGKAPIFVIVSAYAEFEYAKRAMNNGAQYYILKPLEEPKIRRIAEELQIHLLQKHSEEIGKSVRTIVLQTLISGGLSGEPADFAKDVLIRDDYRIAVSEKKHPFFPAEWFMIYDDLYLGIFPGDFETENSTGCGFSRSGNRNDSLGEKIREALTAYDTKRFYDTPRSVVYEESGFPDRGSVEDLLQAITFSNTERVQEILNSLHEKARSLPAMLDEMTVFYNEIILAVFNKFPMAEVQNTMRPFTSCFQLYGILKNDEAFFESLLILISNCTQQRWMDQSVNTMEVVRYVDAHYTESITLEMLSKMFNISLSHLCRQFKKTTGESYTEYLKRKRIEQACELLRNTSLSVAEIGSRVGYSDYFHFNKVFRSVKGISASSYRKNDLK